jgi:hypothetical protein
VLHHSYLPQLAPCNFFVYPWIKQYLKGRHFADVSDVQQELLAALDSISVKDYRQRSQHRKQHWDCCVQSQGEYYEGD